MLKTLLLLSSIALTHSMLMAQTSEYIWKSQLLDKDTQKPVSFAHVLGRGQQVISDKDGFFSIPVRLGDTILFSHVNYDRMAFQITMVPTLQAQVYLRPKENMMPEVIVRDFLPEEVLKQEIVDHEVQYTPEEINATNNVSLSTIMFKYGYVPEMNSLDNFKNYVKEPRGVTLFSSNPSRGLIRSIKKLHQQKKASSLSGLKLNNIKHDSTSLHLFLKPAR